jgi:Glyoxalase/Bleomycin resistance protein/Dioxygenase superfamily
MRGFNHVSLNCRDVAAQERFYVKHFGFQRSRTFRPGQPNQFVMLKLGSIRLELHPSARPPPIRKVASKPSDSSIWLLTLPSLNRRLNHCGPMALNPIQSLTSVSIFPVVGSFSFVTPKGILSSSWRVITTRSESRHDSAESHRHLKLSLDRIDEAVANASALDVALVRHRPDINAALREWEPVQLELGQRLLRQGKALRDLSRFDKLRHD